MADEPMPASDDLGAYPAPHLAVDLVLLTISDGALKVVMMERAGEPFAGSLVLPGGFVHPGETLDGTARRVMQDKTRLDGVPVEQLYTFSTPGRDPRAWVVSVAYFALMPSAELDRGEQLRLVTIAPRKGDIDLILDGEPVLPGFDHQAIVALAVQRLRGKLDWSMVAFGLLPEEFTLFELQRVHELILGHALLKPPFRKKMLDRTFADGRRLAPTGRLSRAGRHRPAELYRLEAH